MSPVGGVGINLAIQDAVARGAVPSPGRCAGATCVSATWRACRCAGGRLRSLRSPCSASRNRLVFEPVLAGELAPRRRRSAQAFADRRLLRRSPRLRAIPAYMFAIGALPSTPRLSRADRWARRSYGPALRRLVGRPEPSPR